ncbi:flagellar biosynthesis protein FlgA [Paenibacillus albicereus]|uniref:Flagellar biosynthesis protein FlgA n=1 Tax=Paenibacillus albicereus TaxID=2726185 RepID=A0A6H2GUU9_9BACL|nr:SAF domain-containing protein [Paenibacillus albicereus]QJC51201.1 flagellar biosynthesis protein FlgA [Paenibacillus albicereus]
MGKRKNRFIWIAAAMLSALLVYGLYLVQLRTIERQHAVQVLVPKRFIAAGERIEAQDLGMHTIPSGAYAEDMMSEASLAAGQEAVVPLGQGEPLRDWKLDSYRLLPARSESTFQLPRDYVLSVSSGIRAGDRVVLYASGAETSSGRLFADPVVVASVKTSGNQEIDDLDNPNLLSLAEGNRQKMYASRRDANGLIEFVNLNLTEAQWLRIDELCKGGETKLVIAYSSDSLDIAGSEHGP